MLAEKAPRSRLVIRSAAEAAPSSEAQLSSALSWWAKNDGCWPVLNCPTSVSRGEKEQAASELLKLGLLFLVGSVITHSSVAWPRAKTLCVAAKPPGAVAVERLCRLRAASWWPPAFTSCRRHDRAAAIVVPGAELSVRYLRSAESPGSSRRRWFAGPSVHMRAPYRQPGARRAWPGHGAVRPHLTLVKRCADPRPRRGPATSGQRRRHAGYLDGSQFCSPTVARPTARDPGNVWRERARSAPRPVGTARKRSSPLAHAVTWKRGWMRAPSIPTITRCRDRRRPPGDMTDQWASPKGPQSGRA